MKKVILIIVLTAMLLTAGCSEETKVAPGIRPISSWVLPRTDQQKAEFAKWVEAYGPGAETLTRYNEAILLQIADQHGGVINKNVAGLRMTLSESDPNSLANMVVDNRRQNTEDRRRHKWLAKLLDDRTADIDKRLAQLQKETEDVDCLSESQIQKMYDLAVEKLENAYQITSLRIDELEANLPDKPALGLLEEFGTVGPREPIARWKVTIEQQTDYLGNRWDIDVNCDEGDTEEDVFEKAVEQIKATSDYYPDVPFEFKQAIKVMSHKPE